MREIIFRGKRVDNDEWVYGFLRCGNYIDVWVPHTWKDEDGSTGEYATVETYQVDPKTVGQYVGLCDDNGAEVFEGDLILYKGNEREHLVDFIDGCFFPFDTLYTKGFKVTGNIYDNEEK